jgi:AcrR family transcriptional regulator
MKEGNVRMPKSGESTRKTILDAANRVVQERGVDRLTLELTAHEAGLSKGGLLYHFPSKEALIKGMIQDYLDRFTADFNATAQQEAEQTPGRWTRSYLYTTYEDKQRSPSMSSGLLAAVATNPTLLSPMQQTFEEWVRLLVKDGIDSTTAIIVRLAVDGLWMVDLFGFAPPDPVMREKVLRALDGMIQAQTSESDVKEESASSS